MSRKLKIAGAVLTIVIAVVAIVYFQARQIIISLVESASNNQVQVKIGGLYLDPFNRSLQMHNVNVIVRDKFSDSYKEATIENLLLNIESVWAFMTGGTLVIEKITTDHALFTLYNSEMEQAASKKFNFYTSLNQIKKNAIRFRIRDITLKDYSVTLLKHNGHSTSLKHIDFHAENLYLSADSIIKEDPLIEFSLPAQSITNETGLTLKFDTLYFSSKTNSAKAINVYFESPKGQGNTSIKVQSNALELKQLNFEALYTGNKLIVDTLYMGKTDLALNLTSKNADQMQSTPHNESGLPDIVIRKIILEELKADLQLSHDSIQNQIQIGHAKGDADNFIVNLDSARKISVAQFSLLVTNYQTSLKNKHTLISFDTVHIQRHKMNLLNFTLRTDDQKLPLLKTKRFELIDVDWYPMLFNTKLQAYEAIAINPAINTVIKPANTTNSNNTKNVIGKLQDFLNVEHLTLSNTNVNATIPDKNLTIALNGMKTSIKVRDFIGSKSLNDALQSITVLSFDRLSFRQPTATAYVFNFYLSNNKATTSEVVVVINEKLIAKINGLGVEEIIWDDQRKGFKVGELKWKLMNLAITKKDINKKDSNQTEPINLVVGEIGGGNTAISYTSSNLEFKTIANHILINQLSISDSIAWETIAVDGDFSQLITPQFELSLHDFIVNNKSITLNAVEASKHDEDSLKILIRQINIGASSKGLLDLTRYIEYVDLDGISASYSYRDSLKRMALGVNGNLKATHLDINKDSIHVGSINLKTELLQFIQEEKKMTSEVRQSDRRELGRNLGRRHDALASSKFRNNTGKNLMSGDSAQKAKYQDHFYKLRSDRGGIEIQATGIALKAGDSIFSAKALINSIRATDVFANTPNSEAELNSAEINNLNVNTDHFKDLSKIWTANNKTASISDLKGHLKVNGNQITLGGFAYDPLKASVTLGNFSFRPDGEVDGYLAESLYQTNYIDTRIGLISFNGFNPSQLFEDSIFNIAKIQINSPSLSIHRDKTKPFFSTQVKWLPTNSFQRLGVKFRVDTIQLNDGRIAYHEKSRVTGQKGTIYFDDIKGNVTNVRNVDLDQHDSLTMIATATMFDSAKVEFQFKESYSDSLGKFMLISHVSPFHTSVLNPTLIPLASVDFKSGFIDTLHMKAIGHEHVAVGSMKMKYRDLKVEFINENDTSRHTLKNQLMKFAANTFVIRTNNTKRVGKIYYERDRNRAIFQYWVKMIMSGMGSSVGAKTNKKEIKRYLKQLNQKKLPILEEG